MAKKKRGGKPQQASRQAPPLRRPETREIAVAQVTDKYSEYPSNGLTPVRLAEIFKEADAGDVLRQMELYEELEEKDPHLFSQMQTRKNAVTGLDFEIIPFDSDDERDKEIAEFIEGQINSIESFEDVQNDLLDAIGKGFAVSEIIWGYDEGHVVVKEIKSRHQKRFFWDSVDDSFKVRTAGGPGGIELPTNKFILHKYKARSGHPSRAGVLRVVAWMYLFKNYDLKDWVSFCGNLRPTAPARQVSAGGERGGQARAHGRARSNRRRCGGHHSRTGRRSSSSRPRRTARRTFTSSLPATATNKSRKPSSGRR